ncbi:hypothetical protein P8935_24105 [Telmatobacter sp. DSM 110680]|uniref:Uncharacterized protein n=1 Tax=Telmatobacter sp. DSM 110680 TaxID=3036704 RepID=A0AAU7DKM2_9BACT
MFRSILLLIALCATLTLSAEPAKAPAAKRDQPSAQKTEQAPTVTISKLVVQEPPKEEKSWWDRFWQPENVPNILLFIVGALGVPIAACTLVMLWSQTKAIRETLDVSKRTLLLQFRPILTVRGLRAMGLLQNPKYPEETKVFLAIENSGGSDAHIDSSEIVVKTVDYNTDIMEGAISLGKMTLKPGQGHVKNIPIDDELVKAMVAETAHMDQDKERKSQKPLIMCMGNIKYVDDLNITRTLTLYRRFNPRTFEFLPIDANDSDFRTETQL